MKQRPVCSKKNIPIIYHTANSDEATFNRAKQTWPAAFITKPFKQLDLQRVTELTNIEFGIQDIFGQGDKITKHWIFKGVHMGEFFGIPATGKTVAVQGSAIARMKNGIIVEEQDFFDKLDLLVQLGIVIIILVDNVSQQLVTQTYLLTYKLAMLEYKYFSITSFFYEEKLCRSVVSHATFISSYLCSHILRTRY